MVYDKQDMQQEEINSVPILVVKFKMKKLTCKI